MMRVDRSQIKDARALPFRHIVLEHGFTHQVDWRHGNVSMYERVKGKYPLKKIVERLERQRKDYSITPLVAEELLNQPPKNEPTF